MELKVYLFWKLMDLPKYFVLNGIKAFTANSLSEYVEPKIFEVSINLRNLGKITIIDITKSQQPHSFNPLGRAEKKNFPVYKSNLQKCVRRQLADNAVRTAYAMMSYDLPNFLRRLPIIMLEDVLPHPSIITLTWFMMACSKGYLLSDKQVEYILGIVYTISKINEYQVFNSGCKTSGKLSDSVCQWCGLTNMEKDLLWSLEFRKAYGGMKCDTEMINYLQEQWLNRFSEPQENELWSRLKSIKIKRINLDSVLPVDKSDIILEAIDQHCYPWLPAKLIDLFPEYSENEIKGAIWFYRSRLNKRKVCQGSVSVKYMTHLKDVYENIENELEKWCEWIYKKLI